VEYRRGASGADGGEIPEGGEGEMPAGGEGEEEMPAGLFARAWASLSGSVPGASSTSEPAGVHASVHEGGATGAG